MSLQIGFLWFMGHKPQLRRRRTNNKIIGVEIQKEVYVSEVYLLMKIGTQKEKFPLVLKRACHMRMLVVS